MPKTGKVRLTKSVVDALPTDQESVVFDCELRGFGIRVKPGGTRTFLIQFRNKQGRSRRVSLGQYGPMTVAQARARAKVELGRVAGGEDVAVEREETRQAMTVAALGELYFAAAQKGTVRGKRGLPKKPSTLSADGYRWKRHIKPLLGTRKVRELERRDIADFLRMANTRAQQAGHESGGERRLKGLLGGVLGWAVDQGIIEANPCAGVKTRPDGKRTVALGEAGYKMLGSMLAAADAKGETWQAIEAIRLLALTGCRRGEITGLRWSEIDFAGRAIRLGDTKTGKSVRPLGQAAYETLRSLEGKSSSKFVFPSARKARKAARADEHERPFDGLPKAYGRICRGFKTALGEPVSPHGLRHAYASVAGLMYQVPTVAALIGHAAGSVTERYIHQVDAALLAAADETSRKIAGWMQAGAAKPWPGSQFAIGNADLKELEKDQHKGLADHGQKTDKKSDDKSDLEKVRILLDAHAFTKQLDAATRGALEDPLVAEVCALRAGLPKCGVGKKPTAWALDILVVKCEAAFRANGVPTSAWSHDESQSPFLDFVKALAGATGFRSAGASIKQNAIRGRRIESQ
jgi:integrase